MRRGDNQFYLKLVKNCKEREFYFTNRVIPDWNALSNHAKEANSVNSFKARIDKEGYNIEKDQFKSKYEHIRL